MVPNKQVLVPFGNIIVIDRLEALAPLEENLRDGEEEGSLFLTITLLKPLRGPAGTFTLSPAGFFLVREMAESEPRIKDWRTILGTMSSFSKLENRAVMLSLESISRSCSCPRRGSGKAQDSSVKFWRFQTAL